MKQRENSAAGMVVGMAAGAALGAAGVMMATQSKRQMSRNVRKVMQLVGVAQRSADIVAD